MALSRAVISDRWAPTRAGGDRVVHALLVHHLAVPIQQVGLKAATGLVDPKPGKLQRRSCPTKPAARHRRGLRHQHTQQSPATPSHTTRRAGLRRPTHGATTSTAAFGLSANIAGLHVPSTWVAGSMNSTSCSAYRVSPRPMPLRHELVVGPTGHPVDARKPGPPSPAPPPSGMADSRSRPWPRMVAPAGTDPRPPPRSVLICASSTSSTRAVSPRVQIPGVFCSTGRTERCKRN